MARLCFDPSMTWPFAAGIPIAPNPRHPPIYSDILCKILYPYE